MKNGKAIEIDKISVIVWKVLGKEAMYFLFNVMGKFMKAGRIANKLRTNLLISLYKKNETHKNVVKTDVLSLYCVELWNHCLENAAGSACCLH